jgi:plasmid stabilization system protein ParE
VTYRLRVTARAVSNADEAYAWIAGQLSLAQAERWYQGLFKHMETLTRQPTRCPRAPERDRFPDELRELVHGKARNHVGRLRLEPVRGVPSDSSG